MSNENEPIKSPILRGDQRKDCCKDDANLELTQLDKNRAVRLCKICGCRHFELTVDPGELGLRGKSIGG